MDHSLGPAIAKQQWFFFFCKRTKIEGIEVGVFQEKNQFDLEDLFMWHPRSLSTWTTLEYAQPITYARAYIENTRAYSLILAVCSTLLAFPHEASGEIAPLSGEAIGLPDPDSDGKVPPLPAA